MAAETAEGPHRWTQEDLEMLSEGELRELVQAENLPQSPDATTQSLIDALLAHQHEQAGEG